MGVIDKNTGELRSTYDILQDLSKAWGSLTSVEKQELTETVAGKTQRSLFTAIMTNFSTAVGATEAALNSEGSATEENSKRMESLQGRLTQLDSAWQDFARNTIDSTVVKSLLSLGTEILKFANTDMGRFIMVITSAVAAVGLFNKVMTVTNLLKFAGASQILTQAVAAGSIAFNVASVSGNTFTASMYAVGASIEAGTKAMLASPLFAVAAGALAIYGIIEAVNTLVPRMEDLETATENSTQAYEDAVVKTKEYRTNLDDINKKIESIQSKGKLSITDEKDLDNLKEQKVVLEQELEILQKVEKAKKEAAAVDITKELDYRSENPFDYWNVDDTEKSIENVKKILKDSGNDIADILGNDRENIESETRDMADAYRALGEEISKQREKMANSESVSEEDQKKLNEMTKAYGELGGHLAENYDKFKEWSETLEGGGEQAEETKERVDSLRESINNTLGTTTEAEEVTTNVTTKQEELAKVVDDTTTAMENQSSTLDTMQEAFNTMISAVDEYNNNGYLSIDTLQSLLALDDEYLSMLTLQDGQLSLNTTSIDMMTDSLINQKVQELQAAAAKDLYNLAIGNTSSLSETAKTAVANAGNSAETTGGQFQSAVPKINEFTGALQAAKAAAGDATTDVDFDSKANAIIGSYQNIFRNITALGGSTTKAAGTSSKGHKYTGSGSSKKSSSGSGKSASKSSTAKEEYKAEIDSLYTYKNALENAKESVDKLNDALKNTDNFNEQERYLKQLIDATNNQINKTNDLKNAQTNQINDYINQLRAQGFAINYNNQTNELYINNMQHLADFSGDTAKNLEKLIDKTQDLNSDNRKLDGSVRDLTADTKDYYDQLSDIPEQKLKKFNELMEEFQQSRLDQVQNQIDDLQHEMDNDERIKAIEKQIEALEKQNDELDNQKELEEKLLAVEEAKIKLQNARNQKTLQVYREGQGFVYEADIDTIKEAADELKDAQDDLNDKVRQDQINQLQAEKDALEKSYQDRIDALEKFLDDQNYLIDKANREGVQTFQELQNELAKFGLDSAEYLGKATDWLNNYNSALSNLNTTVGGILSSSSNATDGLIYSSATQDRINQALSGIIPQTTTTGLSLSNIDYDKLSGTTENQSIYINSIELPNVSNVEDFVEALKDLPRLATSQSALRN